MPVVNIGDTNFFRFAIFPVLEEPAFQKSLSSPTFFTRIDGVVSTCFIRVAEGVAYCCNRAAGLEDGRPSLSEGFSGVNAVGFLADLGVCTRRFQKFTGGGGAIDAPI